MASKIGLILSASVIALAWQMAMTAPAAADNAFSKVDLAPDKRGGIQDMEDIAKYCGTKPGDTAKVLTLQGVR